MPGSSRNARKSGGGSGLSSGSGASGSKETAMRSKYGSTPLSLTAKPSMYSASLSSLRAMCLRRPKIQPHVGIAPTEN